MTMKTLLFSALVLATTPAFAGQNISANVYDSRAALSSQTAELATVVATRPVEIRNSGSNPGTFVGATVGAVGGYALTRGSTSYAARGLGGVLGGVVGGAVGQSLGNRAGPHHAVQIFVQRYMQNGRPYSQLTSVVEADDQGEFRPGERVLLVRGREGLSVVKVAVATGTSSGGIGPDTDDRAVGSYATGTTSGGLGEQP
jgi:outer membrane lipoprotein SlyB